jgi:hypothetical protein
MTDLETLYELVNDLEVASVDAHASQFLPIQGGLKMMAYDEMA